MAYSVAIRAAGAGHTGLGRPTSGRPTFSRPNLVRLENHVGCEFWNDGKNRRVAIGIATTVGDFTASVRLDSIVCDTAT